MAPSDTATAVIEPNMPHPGTAGRARAWPRRALAYLLPVALSLPCVAGVFALGQATHWRLGKASDLRGVRKEQQDDWCHEHGVPDSVCVECRPDLLPQNRASRWCKEHAVPECPLCHPDVAQLPFRPEVSDADRAVAARSLVFAQRPVTDKKCQKHLRRIQLASDEIVPRLGIGFAKAVRGPAEEFISAPGEATFDPTRVSRVSPRAAGTLVRVERQIGDKVRRGDVLAVIDSAEVGRAKAEFQQAVVQLELRQQTLAKLQPNSGSTVPAKVVQAAEAAVEESQVRLLLAGEQLANLGLPLREDVRGLSPSELANRMQFLGLPDALAADLASTTASSNLLPVTAPHDGEVTTHTAVTGESADAARPLFVVADTSRMWLTLRVRPEDISRVKPGQPVRFQHPGHTGPSGWDSGSVVWVSPAADESTRTVPVRADLPNPSDRHPGHTFGVAQVHLREEPRAVLVPSSAVHWEGCCNIVFVRDKNWGKPGIPPLFHVRKVRPGASVDTPNGPRTEIAAGLLPDEVVATTGSGNLRSELLKNGLGEGCACCAGK